ncbi:MAG: GSCFA domain protein [Bacteroidetes bacterium HGW-Bacteroidetes-10]|nr:MAG: GSCFA domain protein [Bacteroidetes bacterium HGW-Bacteroidetes-10]
MKWNTPVETGSSPFWVSYRDKILFLGSCFAQEIGKTMQNMGFESLVNPFGVLYNPASIAFSLEKLMTGAPFKAEDVIQNDDIFKSIYHSSDYADISADGLLGRINDALAINSAFFHNSDVVALTMGTTWIYKLREDGRVVANCHKLPSDAFTRECLSVEDTVNMLSPFIEKYPSKRWIISVSPVRHFKDGAHENQLSKSRLLLASDELSCKYSNVCYFPSYEIVMDELRDYRFYAADLIHLNREATDYIWERFAGFILDDKSKELLRDYKRLFEMKSHRPLFPGSKNYKEFEKRLCELEEKLKKR